MRSQAMSEEQLAAFIAKLKADAGLQEKIKGATDCDVMLEIAKEAGFDVSKADWLRYQAIQTLELSDAELEEVAGATGHAWCGVCTFNSGLPGGEEYVCQRTCWRDTSVWY